MSDDLTLTVGGRSISGWTEIKLTRGIEVCPSSFNLLLTDLDANGSGVVVYAGDPCTVHLGGDLVVTGYVDSFEPILDAESHSIRVTGRGKCQDLVDCSAERPTGQFKGLNLLQIAQELAAPYGITVTQLGAAKPIAIKGQPATAVIPQFNLMLTESPYDIIERLCRFSQLLCYEGPDGNLILAQGGGTARATGGIEQGVNVLSAHGKFTMNDRFSEIDVYLMDLDVWADAGNGGNMVARTTDPNVNRNRKKALIAEGGTQGSDLALARATWEASRRLGRSFELTATVDSWRDSADVLWTPNTQIPIHMPACTVDVGSVWTLGEVTYMRDEQGTRAELIMMPYQAFTPEPVLLQPIAPDIAAGSVPPAKP